MNLTRGQASGGNWRRETSRHLPIGMNHSDTCPVVAKRVDEDCNGNGAFDLGEPCFEHHDDDGEHDAHVEQAVIRPDEVSHTDLSFKLIQSLETIKT